jgi:hypothetical protein
MSDAFSRLTADEIARANTAAPTAENDEYTVVMPVPAQAGGIADEAGFLTGLRRRPDHVWPYRSSTGELLYAVARWNMPDGGKQIRPFTWARDAAGRGGWRAMHAPAPRPLYGLDRLAQGKPDAWVIVVEGEKAADAARSLFNEPVVTSAGGAAAAEKADWSPLFGRKVIIWPDADEPGTKYATAVVRLLARHGGRIRMLDAAALAGMVPGASDRRTPPAGWDAADAADEGWTGPFLRSVLADNSVELRLEELRSEAASPDPIGTSDTIGTAGAFRPLDRSMLGTGRSPAPEFPTRLLGQKWGAWCVQHATTRSTAADYVATGLLTVAASLIGNARWARISPEWPEPPVLWAALVGGPSSGKSPALDPVLRIVREIEALAMEAARPRVQEREEAIQRARAAIEAWQGALRTAAKNGDPSPERPIDAIEPEPLALPRLLVSDVTVEKLAAILRDMPKGLLVNRDEIAGWVESFGRYSGASGAERALWLEAFGGRSFRVDRQSRPEPIIIDRLSVSVLGGIQPDRLTVINGAADDGFAARFLYAWPEAVDAFTVRQETIDGTAQRVALQRLADLALQPDEFAKLNPSYISLSAAALHHLEAFGGTMKRAANEASGPLAGALGKAVVHAIRLALVVEFLWWAEAGGAEPGEISDRAMLAGIGLVDGYYVPQARRVFREASVPPEEACAIAVAKWIVATKVDRFNARESRRRIGGAVRDAKAMDQACEVLVEAGAIMPDPTRTGNTLGRTAKDYRVNPAVHKEVAR